MSKIVNKVRVIAEFPGYEIGDILILNPNTGVFNFAKVTKEDGEVTDVLDAFDNLAAGITDSIKQSFTKKDVILYLDDYFADISIYKLRTPRELDERVHELKAHMDRIKEDDTFDELDREEAMTVWQNMIWEYEWILGRKDMYYTTTSPSEDNKPMDDEIENTFIDLPVDELLGDFIDGNALEAEKTIKYTEDDTDNPTEDRKDS